MRARPLFIVAAMVTLALCLVAARGWPQSALSANAAGGVWTSVWGALRGGRRAPRTAPAVPSTPAVEASRGGPSGGGQGDSWAPREALTPLRVVVISDLNGRYGTLTYSEEVHRAVQEIIARRPDVVLSTGDMVAGQREGLDYRGMWQGFHAAVTTPLREAGIPLLITPGNHDGATSPRFALERAIFADEWQMHRPKVKFVDDRDYPVRYSAVVGDTFFISLDATTVGALPDEQMHWLEAQLIRAQAYPSRIVFGHVPLYAVSEPKKREIIGDPALEALFNRYRVSAYLSGHHHTYYPGARGSLRLIAMPCLGSGLRTLIAAEQEILPKAFVEFSVMHGGLYDVDAWKAPSFRETIDRESLPMKIGLAAGVLVRDDLMGLDLRMDAMAGPICKGVGDCGAPVAMDVLPNWMMLPDGLGR